MPELSVIGNDPFRLDTPKHNREGEWFREQVNKYLPDAPTIHLRGLHYVLVTKKARKPDGTVYRNNGDDWVDLGGYATAARWLGYVPFERLSDERNSPPTIREFIQPEPRPRIWDATDAELPADSEFRAQAHATDFLGAQPYRLALWGEKSSLEDVLGPLCTRWEADLYLPSGDASDTMIYQMAKAAAADGRPLVAFYFSDCDPSGWAMPHIVARKLQAHQARDFPELEFEVRAVALHPDQVKEFGLPDSPIKDTDERGPLWEARWHVQQTEIDALAALEPALLRQIAEEAVGPFFDATLARRVRIAEADWEAEAQEALDEQLAGTEMDGLQAEVGERLAELQNAITAVEELKDEYDYEEPKLPDPDVPVPEETERDGLAPSLIDSRWDWTEQTLRLLDRKRYGLGKDEYDVLNAPFRAKQSARAKAASARRKK